MKSRTIIDAIVKPLRVRIIKQSKPIVIVIKRFDKVSFRGLMNIQDLLASVAAIEIHPARIRTKIKLNPKIASNRVQFNLIFKSQSELLKILIEEKKQAIVNNASIQWNKKYPIKADESDSPKKGTKPENITILNENKSYNTILLVMLIPFFLMCLFFITLYFNQ